MAGKSRRAQLQPFPLQHRGWRQPGEPQLRTPPHGERQGIACRDGGLQGLQRRRIPLGARRGSTKDYAQNQGEATRCRLRSLQQFLSLLYDLQRMRGRECRRRKGQPEARILRGVRPLSGGRVQALQRQVWHRVQDVGTFQRVGYQLLVPERFARGLSLRLPVADSIPPNPGTHPAPVGTQHHYFRIRRNLYRAIHRGFRGIPGSGRAAADWAMEHPYV